MTTFMTKTKQAGTGTFGYGKQVGTAKAGVFTFGYGYQQRQANGAVVYHTLKVVLSAISAKRGRETCPHLSEKSRSFLRKGRLVNTVCTR